MGVLFTCHIVSFLGTIAIITCENLFALVHAGHGFKLSPVVGKVVTELLMGDTPSVDLTPFQLSRFQTGQQ